MTAQVQSVVNQTPDGTASNPSVITLPSRQCYETDGVIVIQNRHYLTLNGSGDTFSRTVKPTQAFAPQVQIEGSSNLTVENLTVNGPKPTNVGYTSDTEPGIQVDSSSGITLSGLTVTNTYADGIYLSGTDNQIFVSHVTIDQSGRHGIGVVGGSNIWIDSTHTTNSHQWSIDMEPTGQTVNIVALTNDFWETPNLGFIDGAPQQGSGQVCDADPNTPDCATGLTNVTYSNLTESWS